MEHTELKKTNWNAIRQTIFMILLAIAIAALIAAIFTIKNNVKTLGNPMGYNMHKFGLNYCTCWDKEDKIVLIQNPEYNGSVNNYRPEIEYTPTKEFEFNLSKINLSGVKG
jgi:hypothetical protein